MSTYKYSRIVSKLFWFGRSGVMRIFLKIEKSYLWSNAPSWARGETKIVLLQHCLRKVMSWYVCRPLNRLQPLEQAAGVCPVTSSRSQMVLCIAAEKGN